MLSLIQGALKQSETSQGIQDHWWVPEEDTRYPHPHPQPPTPNPPRFRTNVFLFQFLAVFEKKMIEMIGWCTHFSWYHHSSGDCLQKSVTVVAFWIDKNEHSNTGRNVEQTKMYVCTLKNIYSSRCSHIAVQVGTQYGTEYALEML